MRITKHGLIILLFSSMMFAQDEPLPGYVSRRPAQATQQAAPAPSNLYPATLSGKVVRAAGEAPLPRTSILLISENPGKPGEAPYQTSAVTDQNGYYEFSDLPPDRYSLIIERPGFIEQGTDSRRPQIARTITLNPGQNLTGIDFRLIQPAVLTGRVLNEDGEPIPRAHIIAFRQTYSLRGRSLQPTRFESTNDLGEFRIFDLPPGTYYVAVSVRDPFEGISIRSKAKQFIYPTVFYPNTRDESEAAPIHLTAGEENRANFNLSPVPAVHVRGTVHGLIAQNRRGAANVVITTAGQAQAGQQPRGSTDDQGNFDIPGVTSGNYTLVAISFGGQELGPLMGRTAVHVGETDVNNADVTVGSNRYEIEGRVTIEADTRTKSDGLVVALSNLNGDTTDEQFMGASATPVDKNGKFTIRAGAGQYAINVTASRGGYEDYYVKSMYFSSQDLSEAGTLTTSSSGGTLELVMSSHGGRVAGIVVDENKRPIPAMELALVPDFPYRKRLDLYTTRQSDQDGNFEIRGVMPGDYLLLPLPTGTDEGAYYDPDYLVQHESEVRRIHVDENRATPVTVTIPNGGK